MRALLKDKEDSTLIAIEVTEAVYDPEEQILYLRNADASYQVESIIAVNADAAIRELFDRGAVDPSTLLVRRMSRNDPDCMCR